MSFHRETLGIRGTPPDRPRPRAGRGRGWIPVLLAMLVLAVVSCEGDYSSEGRSELRSSVFESSGGSEPDTLVLEMVGADQNVLTVALKAQELSEPVYGLALDLEYDPDVLEFLDHAPQDFFSGPTESDGPPICRASLLDGETGRLVLGASRVGPLPGVAGSGRILTVRFRGLKTGQSTLKLRSLVCRGPDLTLVDGIWTKESGIARITRGPVASE